MSASVDSTDSHLTPCVVEQPKGLKTMKTFYGANQSASVGASFQLPANSPMPLFFYGQSVSWKGISYTELVTA